jgi:hypothetical protein
MDDMHQGNHNKTVLSNRTEQAEDEDSPDPKSSSDADYGRENEGVPLSLQTTQRASLDKATKQRTTCSTTAQLFTHKGNF